MTFAGHSVRSHSQSLSEIVEHCRLAYQEGRYADLLALATERLLAEEHTKTRGILHQYAGRAAWQVQRPDLSLHHFGAAVSDLTDLDEPDLLLTALIDYGLALYEPGHHAKALEQYLAAQALQPTDGSAEKRVLDRRIATLLLDEGRFEEAKTALGPELPQDAPIDQQFAWHTYHLLYLERTGQIAKAQLKATLVREVWDQHHDKPEIMAMVGGVLNALRVDGILRGDAFVRPMLDDLATQAANTGALNVQMRLALLKAELAQQGGDDDQALAILDQIIDQCAQVYKQLPVDALLARKTIMAQSGQEEEFFDYLDQFLDGTLRAGTFPLGEITSESCALLLAVLDAPQLRKHAPAFVDAAAMRVVTLIANGVPAEIHWQALACLARVSRPLQSKIIFAKLACNQISKTAATAFTFQSAYLNYLRVRRAPFEDLIDQLYQAGRLHEGRQVADIAQRLVRRMALTIRAGQGDAAMTIPLSAAETQVAARLLLQPESATTIFDGSVWSSGPTAPAPPERPDSGISPVPVLRFAQTSNGYWMVFSGPRQSGVHRVDAALPELTIKVVKILETYEAGNPAVAGDEPLATTLLGPFGDDVGASEHLYVRADGVLAALPFRALFSATSQKTVVYLTDQSARDESADNQSAPFKPVKSICHLIGEDTADEAQLESQALAGLAPLTRLPLSMDALTKALSTPTDILHISCHYDFQPTAPWGSELATSADVANVNVTTFASLLADPSLTVARIVFLAFCDGAAVVHDVGPVADLPGALIAQGAEAVIGAAWKIQDHDAARFSAAFYGHLGAHRDVLAAFGHAERTTGFYGFKLFLHSGQAPSETGTAS